MIRLPRLALSSFVTVVLLGLVCAAGTATAGGDDDLWVLKPLVRPPVPTNVTPATNPIDAFVAASYQQHHLKPVGPADKRTLLRRVYLDLTGLPPTPSEQQTFLDDPSPDAYDKVVDRLLASDQHGVRYARHWLDVLRYADADERMIAAPGLYLWRDWVIRAINEDVPYDQFGRAQLTGQRSANRTQMSATGYRSRVEPRPDDMFALGFLARGQVIRDGKDNQELAITAVETVSTAFMGLTVGCAKCHNHMYDPIKKRDFYAMKALFDPLVLKKVYLASAAERIDAGRVQDEIDRKKAELQKPIDELVAPYRQKLYDERVAMLPDDVRAIVLKPERSRTPAEQKIADDYFPVLRIDSDKISEAMPPDVRKKYQDLQRQLSDALGNLRGGTNSLPAFWTVESDPRKELDKSYELTSGDPDRPELNHEVQPGWPFQPKDVDFRDGRREAFSDWLTAPDNPMFARVAVNRLWQWHFGEGLQKLSSDFGNLGGTPSNPALLDWLAAEFVARGFSMKAINKLIVTSDTYKLASASTSMADADAFAADTKADPSDTYLWRSRLQRLEAEPIWDSIFTAAGDLDLAVGGPSFDPRGGGRGAMSRRRPGATANRRAVYMVRGYSTQADVTPTFLQAFDVDDGRAPCPLRTQTVTAPQALFMMNSPEIERASGAFAQRLRQTCGDDLPKAVDLAYRTTLARPPSPTEAKTALDYLDHNPDRLKGLTWMLFNLDEFIYAK